MKGYSTNKKEYLQNVKTFYFINRLEKRISLSQNTKTSNIPTCPNQFDFISGHA